MKTLCWYCGLPERWLFTRWLLGRRLRTVRSGPLHSDDPLYACSPECVTMAQLGTGTPAATVRELTRREVHA